MVAYPVPESNLIDNGETIPRQQWSPLRGVCLKHGSRSLQPYFQLLPVFHDNNHNTMYIDHMIHLQSCRSGRRDLAPPPQGVPLKIDQDIDSVCSDSLDALAVPGGVEVDERGSARANGFPRAREGATPNVVSAGPPVVGPSPAVAVNQVSEGHRGRRGAAR